MTNAELTAENRPAFLQVNNNGEKLCARGTHENQGRVQVFVVLLHVVVVILGRLPLIGDVEVGSRILGLDWGKEVTQCILDAGCLINTQHIPVHDGIRTCWGLFSYTRSESYPPMARSLSESRVGGAIGKGEIVAVR